MHKTSIVGIVRFSALSTLTAPFRQHQGKGFDQIAALILDEARLAQRFRLFETITLPSLDAQDDPDFALLLVAPRLLPEHWKARLAFLATERPWLSVHYADETGFRMAKASPAALELLDTEQSFCTFRLDDDDALAMDFVSRLRAYVGPAFVGHGVSFCRGHYVQTLPDDYRIWSRIRPNLGVGLAYVSSALEKRTIFDISERHPTLHQFVPVITDARRDSFVVSAHEGNDSGRTIPEEHLRLSAAEASSRLRRLGFAVELELLEHLRTAPLDGSMLKLATRLRPDPAASLTVGRSALAAPADVDRPDVPINWARRPKRRQRSVAPNLLQRLLRRLRKPASR